MLLIHPTPIHPTPNTPPIHTTRIHPTRPRFPLVLALALALAAPVAAVTLDVTPDRSTYEPGELIVLRVTGDSEGATETGAFGFLRYSQAVTTPRGVNQSPPSAWGAGPVRQGGVFAEAMNQIGSDTAASGAFSTIGVCAESPAAVSTSWIEHTPYRQLGLTFFGIGSAPGTSFTIVAPGTPPPYDGINVDLGAGAGSPAASYGAAAGQAGTWNTIGTGVHALLDLDGNASGASVTVTADDDTGSVAGPATDDHRLLGDAISDSDCLPPDQWSLAFTGLHDGTHEVTLYAPADTGTDTGDMLVDGTAVSSLPGNLSTLENGVSWARVWVDVTGGTLDISGSDLAAGGQCSGLAGVQLVVNCLPEPSGGSMLLAGALAVWGLGRRRRPSGT